jgi:transposase
MQLAPLFVDNSVMKPLSIDLRQRIVQAHQLNDGTKQQIADRFAVSVASVKKLISQWQKLGTIEPQYQTVGRKPAFNKQQFKELDELLQQRCDITLAEIKEHFQGKVKCSIVTIHSTLKRLGWGYKKNRYVRLSKIEKM